MTSTRLGYSNEGRTWASTSTMPLCCCNRLVKMKDKADAREAALVIVPGGR